MKHNSRKQRNRNKRKVRKFLADMVKNETIKPDVAKVIMSNAIKVD